VARPFALATLALGLAASGCAGKAYYRFADAPESIRQGRTDPRLAVTQRFGEALSPIVRNIAAPYGRLRFAPGLEEHLAATLMPLDIVLVRSRPALTRLAFPSHFTHSLVWLGTPRQIAAQGGDGVAAVRARMGDLQGGRTVFESAGDAVRLSGIDQVLNTDEIAILRPARRGAGKYAALFSDLGKPFDYNFDFGDKSKLTCMEAVAEAFPEIGIPVRYTAGRYAIIPDDIVRRSLTPGSGLAFVEYIRGTESGGFSAAGRAAAAAALSQPAPKPGRATIY
jgi:hypothetical protein